MTAGRGNLPAPVARTKRSALIPDLNGMTGMQQRFVEEYLIDLNGKQAAIRAGFEPANASRAATTLMRFQPVRDAIARAMAARSARVGISQDRVLQHLGALVFGDPASIFNENGGLKKPGEMDEFQRKLVAGVKTRRIVTAGEDGEMHPEEITEIKTVDNIAATQLLMRHMGMLNDKLDVTVTPVADRLAAAWARLKGLGLGEEDGPVIDHEADEDASTAAEVAALEAEAAGLAEILGDEPEPVTLEDILGDD